MLKRVVTMLLLGSVFNISGCGSLSERDPQSPKYYSFNYYYPGVQYDWGMLTLKSSGGHDYKPVFCYLSIVCPFVIVLGMPVDFVVDTLLLYSDHRHKLIADKEFEGYVLDTYCRAEGGPDEEALKRHDLDINYCPGKSVQ